MTKPFTDSAGSPASRRHSGFTLIELSIVLVIIGLIVGGVLVGRDLIHAAEVRKTVSQIEQTKTAIATFRGKYNCLPGDCLNATSFWSAAINGNGDGKISDNGNDGSLYLEPYNLFHQLKLSGLQTGTFGPVTATPDDSNNSVLPSPDTNLAPSVPIAGTFLIAFYYLADASDPYIAERNYIAVSQIPYADWFDFYGSNLTADLQWQIAVDPNIIGLLPLDAFAIDQKMDDGLPYTGSVKPFVLPASLATLGCVKQDASNAYDFSTAAAIHECVLFVNLGL